MSHHLIFEGAELSGKSWLMSQVYDFLEPKYNKKGIVLDGCHWFNCDIGIYGTDKSDRVITQYQKIFEELKDNNILVEKFHISDKVYHRLYNEREMDYDSVEKELIKDNFKVILCTFPEDIELLEKRISDRLNLYPHYQRILRTPHWYINQQKEYVKEVKKSNLPYFLAETVDLPDNELVKKILNWIGE